MNSNTVIPVVDYLNSLNMLSDLNEITINNKQGSILNSNLINHTASVFFIEVSDDAMANQGIYSGDKIMVNKAVKVSSGHIVVTTLDNTLFVRRLQEQSDTKILISDNPEFPPLDITHIPDAIIWGVVTHVMHKVS